MGKIQDRIKKAVQERQMRAQKVSGDEGYKVMVSKTAETDIDPRIVSFYDPESPVSEQYRILRTNILALGAKREFKTIALTSATHGEGKTITAINLAISLSSERDRKKVLLVDGDLRRANVAKYLGMGEPAGITDILVQGIVPDSVFRETGIPGLTLLGAGGKVRNPAELLGSQDFRRLVEYLRSRFDLVIFDSPPVIPVTDGSLIASVCDGVIIVVQSGRTQRGVVNHASGLLRQAGAKITGYVLTNIRYHIPAYIYRYL
ncbi:MAG: CpsD/CapB family tyrosine-protein kinase [Deltaproteobacteria bacterium]